MINFDSSLLLGFYQARTGTGTAAASATAGAKKVAPTAPWSPQIKAPQNVSADVKKAMVGHKFVDENAAQLDLAGASTDYRKLFALYQGLNTLNGVAEQMNAKGVTSTDKMRIQSVFAKGLAEVNDYADSVDLEKLRLTRGEVADKARTTVGAAKASTNYITGPLVTGTSSTVVPAFSGNVQFDMTLQGINGATVVSLDFAEMGAQSRTLANVINYVNGKLAAAGVYTRVASERIPAQPRTVDAGGKKITLPAGQDSWALKIKTDSAEKVTFSAPATAGAVYLAQSVGDPDPDKKATTDDGVTRRQLLKFQTDTLTTPGPTQNPGDANWVADRVFAQDLDPSVKTVRATATAADGSVYMLADVTGKTGGQAIKGTQDVALLKYDSAGKLIYSRTLGASETAKGLALAVAADGKVAIAGSVTGGLNGAVEGPLNSGASGSFAGSSDSFVTLYDDQGDELWTQRRGARADDEASSVTFAADGSVYVAGRARSVMPGNTALGGWDGYVEGFATDTAGKPQTLFTQTTGSTGDDRPSGVVVDGNSIVVASVESGHGILRRYDLQGAAAPTLTATRDIGDLLGGDLVGLALDGGQIVVAGNTANGALSAGNITRGHSGGSDAFAARISADLSNGAGDSLAYYGGTGDDRASALAVGGGQVWLTGSAGADLPGQAAMGKKDGFLAQLDVAAGTIAWSRRFTGKDGYAAPSSIAVAANGASVLDRLGLPNGQLDLTDSQRLVASTSVRAGDQFIVRAANGPSKTVTIANDDTMTTLATKVRRAFGFQAKVEIVVADGARVLQIKPVNPRAILEIEAGKTGRNALEVLGLPEGTVRATVTRDGKTAPADGGTKIYGLGLAGDLSLGDQTQINHTLSELASAMGVIRTAYKDLTAAATPETAAKKATGPVPAYLTNQISNYQAALNRLTGGG